MKTTQTLVLMLLFLAGCQQGNDQSLKTEVDKCVDALVKAVGEETDPLGILPESKNTKVKARLEAEARLECLRAQAGSK